MADINFHDLRSEFVSGTLDEKDISSHPVVLFERWLAEAVEKVKENANAMVLSTVSKDSIPSSRIVLLKDYSSDGFIFFSNYHSRKGQDLSVNRTASLLFFWNELHRQVRVEGEVSKVKAEYSEEYFNSRPEKSRISAIASPQSARIPDRSFLEDKFKEVQRSGVISRPGHWGAYIFKPKYFEFWQGREGRLHDRIVFELENEKWEIYRIAP